MLIEVWCGRKRELIDTLTSLSKRLDIWKLEKTHVKDCSQVVYLFGMLYISQLNKKTRLFRFFLSINYAWLSMFRFSLFMRWTHNLVPRSTHPDKQFYLHNSYQIVKVWYIQYPNWRGFFCTWLTVLLFSCWKYCSIPRGIVPVQFIFL